ncbi:MAG: SDR family NAD(P)-dependent oxidoreductase [Thermoanaerobaculia bacterium]
MSEFEGKTVLIVGASSGIGHRAAERFLAAGANVGVMARRETLLRELAVRSDRDRTLVLAGDASKSEDVERCVAALEERFGPVAILLTCPGLVDPRPIAETTDQQWEESIAANLHAVFRPVRRVLPPMLERGSGAIVLVASISGVSGSSKFPGLVPYAASKAAVIGFAEALAAEVGPRGVRVNALSPGSVDTEMLRAAAPDAVPAMTTDEVAESILFLASERSRPIQGQNLHVYGP